jgi:hypothetical protein
MEEKTADKRDGEPEESLPSSFEEGIQVSNGKSLEEVKEDGIPVKKPGGDDEPVIDGSDTAPSDRITTAARSRQGVTDTGGTAVSTFVAEEPVPPDGPPVDALGMPTLARGARVSTSQPGAVATTPGGGSDVRVPVSFAAFARSADEILPSLPVPETTNMPTAAPLAEARAVDEDEERALQEALPVPLSEAAHKSVLQRFGLPGAIMLVAIVAILCGALLINRKKASDAITNMKPTVEPTGSPTIEPTQAPTSLIAQGYLPNSTLLAIADPLSPQDMAYQWLAEHPDISNMPEWRKVQLFAMATFFYTLHGEQWPEEARNDWLAYEKSECDWFSALYMEMYFSAGKFEVSGYNTNETTCDDDGHFKTLFFKFTSPVREGPTALPPEVSLLSSLDTIDLFGIGFDGPLSSFFIPELKLMSNLRRIKLGSNSFSESLSTTFIDLIPPSLEDLESNKNKGITGTIPTEFGLTKLQKLYLYALNLNGTIPTELGMMSMLKELSLGNNKDLVGTIPTELCRLPDLKELRLLFTGTNGSLPSNFGECSSLSTLQVTAQLTGTMPENLSTQLSELYLGYNALTGAIPFGAFGSSRNSLRSLDLDGNMFSGSIATELGLFWSLEYMLLNHNQLTGTIPNEIGNCTG